MKTKIAGPLLGLIASVALAVPGQARTPAVTQEHLLDRIQIEDMMVEYYTVLTEHVRHDIGAYFTGRRFGRPLSGGANRLPGRRHPPPAPRRPSPACRAIARA